MSQQKKTVIGALIAAVLVAAAALLLFAMSRLESRLDAVPEGAGLALSRSESIERAAVYYNGGKYIERDSLTTLLVLGIDDAELTETHSARNTSQADLILLAVFDRSTKSVTLIQINRDTMTDVPVLDTFGNNIGLTTEQLALAHTYGNGLEVSCENTVNAVSRFLYGVEIDNYFSLTMDAIPIINDLVGGVTVTIRDDFTGVDDTLKQGETVTLTAENVENFVRTRRSMKEDTTNLNRMARQRDYMQGLIEALDDTLYSDSSFVTDAYAALEGSIVTDCTVTKLNSYADLFAHYTLDRILVPEGEAVVGEKFMEFYVDETALQEMVLEVFYEKTE